MKFFSKVCAVSLACFAVSFSGFVSAKSAAEGLTEILQEMLSLKGGFVQQTYSVEGEKLQAYSGNFKLKRPGFFYWHVQAPGQQFLVSDGTQVWDYDVDLEQLIHNKIEGGDVYDSPMQIISGGIGAINAHYRVESAASPDHYVLRPLEVGGGFTQLKLGFENRILARMEMTDAFGQRTEVILSDTELNPVLAASTFQIQAPEGVDIISNVPGYGEVKVDQSGDD